MLANMRMCSNVPAQSVVQTALGGHQSVKDYLVPGGRIYDQRELVYNMLNDIPGITAVKPKAAFYIFPKIDVKKFNIHSDEQFALDLLHDKHILISHGGAFNWQEPDHFRVVYLPRISMLKETIGEIGDFFSTYLQACFPVRFSFDYGRDLISRPFCLSACLLRVLFRHTKKRSPSKDGDLSAFIRLTVLYQRMIQPLTRSMPAWTSARTVSQDLMKAATPSASSLSVTSLMLMPRSASLFMMAWDSS